jgi:hypothetical protein
VIGVRLRQELNMAIDSEITIVSGLPRSGTSLMMQMLQCGGMTILTDEIRTADVHNPRGYFELEKVKKIKVDATWLSGAQGKVFKMVSQLLYDLPGREKYRVIFMDRNLDEVLSSQERMLTQLGRKAAGRQDMKRFFAIHLDRLEAWLQRQAHIQVLHVSYNDLVAQPTREAERVSKFLGAMPHVDKMVSAVDASLYRNRTSLGETT